VPTNGLTMRFIALVALGVAGGQGHEARKWTSIVSVLRVDG